MGFFSRRMGSNGADWEAMLQGFRDRPTPVVRGLGYDATLVSRLTDDHQELLRIFSAIKKAAAEGHFHLLSALLARFKQTFQAHIMLENVKFYVYVQLYCELDSEALRFVGDARREIDGIARSVVKFLNAHIANVPTAATVDGFNAELSRIGEVLQGRVQVEESRLYSLYQPTRESAAK